MAVIEIQKCCRGYLVRKRAKEVKEAKRKESERVEMEKREKKERREQLIEEEMQRKSLVMNTAAVAIQSAFRSFKLRSEFIVMRAATENVQNIYRIYRGERVRRNANRERRISREMNRAKERRVEAAITIQSCYRMHIAKDYLRIKQTIYR